MEPVHLAVVWFPGHLDRNPSIVDSLPLIPQFSTPHPHSAIAIYLKSTSSPTLIPEPAAVSITQAAYLPEGYMSWLPGLQSG